MGTTTVPGGPPEEEVWVGWVRSHDKRDAAYQKKTGTGLTAALVLHDRCVGEYLVWLRDEGSSLELLKAEDGSVFEEAVG